MMSRKEKFNNFKNSKVGNLVLVAAALLIYLFLGSSISLVLGALNGSLVIDFVIAGFGYWYIYTKHQQNVKVNGVQFKNKQEKIAIIVLAIILLLAVCFTAQVFGNALQAKFGDPNFKIYSRVEQQNASLSVIMAIIVAPICEELFFRGFIYNLLRCSYNYLTAAIIAAVIFGLMHGTLTQGFSVILLALFDMAIYELTGKISWSIWCHVFYNVFAMMISGLIVPAILTNSVIITLMYVAVLALILSIFIYIKKNMQPKTQKPTPFLVKIGLLK